MQADLIHVGTEDRFTHFNEIYFGGATWAASPNLLRARIRAHRLVSSTSLCLFGKSPVLAILMLVFVHVPVLQTETQSHKLENTVRSTGKRLNHWGDYTMPQSCWRS